MFQVNLIRGGSEKNTELFGGGGGPSNSQNSEHSCKTPLNYLKITQKDQNILVKKVKILKIL